MVFFIMKIVENAAYMPLQRRLKHQSFMRSLLMSLSIIFNGFMGGFLKIPLKKTLNTWPLDCMDNG